MSFLNHKKTIIQTGGGYQNDKRNKNTVSIKLYLTTLFLTTATASEGHAPLFLILMIVEIKFDIVKQVSLVTRIVF